MYFLINTFYVQGILFPKLKFPTKLDKRSLYTFSILYCVCEKVETKLPLIKAFVSQRLYPASSMSIRNELKRCQLITFMNRKEQLIVLSRRLQRSVALCQSQLVVPRHNDSVPLTIHITRLLLQRCC